MAPLPPEELSIGQIAERTGLSVHTLRFYEREGLLLGPVRRRANGHRVYGREEVEWLSACTRFRASGMPLAAIRRYVELVRQGPGNENDRLAILHRHRRRIIAEIAKLTGSLELIDHKIGVYEAHMTQGRAGDLWNPLPGSAE